MATLTGNRLDEKGELDELSSENLEYIKSNNNSLGFVINNNVEMKKIDISFEYNEEIPSIRAKSSVSIDGNVYSFHYDITDIHEFIDQIGIAIRNSRPFDECDLIKESIFKCIEKCKEQIEELYPSSIVLNYSYYTPGYIYDGETKVGTFDTINISESIILGNINLTVDSVNDLRIRYTLNGENVTLDLGGYSKMFDEKITSEIAINFFSFKQLFEDIIREPISNEDVEKRNYNLFYEDMDEFVVERTKLIFKGNNNSTTNQAILDIDLDFI